MRKSVCRILCFVLILTLVSGSVSGRFTGTQNKVLAPVSQVVQLPAVPAKFVSENGVLPQFAEAVRQGAIGYSLLTGKACVPVLFLFLAAVLSGCSSMSPAEQVSAFTREIARSIQADEPGNSYDLADIADERWDAVEVLRRQGKSRKEIAEFLGLSGKAKELFIRHEIIVDGSKSDDEIAKLIVFLKKIPSSHKRVNHTVLMGVDYDRWYDDGKVGRYYFVEGRIISFIYNYFGKDGIKLSHLGHEWGHAVDFNNEAFWSGKLFWLRHLFLSWGSNAYATKDSEDNHWEEFAEIYEMWIVDTLKFLQGITDGGTSHGFRSSTLADKVLSVARHFLIYRGGRYYLRVYRKGGDEKKWHREWEYDDVLLDIEDPDELEPRHLRDLKKSAFQKDRTSKVRRTRFGYISPLFRFPHSQILASRPAGKSIEKSL